jgi:hypothetical protein
MERPININLGLLRYPGAQYEAPLAGYVLKEENKQYTVHAAPAEQAVRVGNSQVLRDDARDAYGVRTPWVTDDYYVVVDARDVPQEMQGIALDALRWLNAEVESDEGPDDRVLVRDTETGLLDVLTSLEIWDMWLHDTDAAEQAVYEGQLVHTDLARAMGWDEPTGTVELAVQHLAAHEDLNQVVLAEYEGVTYALPLGAYSTEAIEFETNEYKVILDPETDQLTESDQLTVAAVLVSPSPYTDHPLAVRDKRTNKVLVLTTEEIVSTYRSAR